MSFRIGGGRLEQVPSVAGVEPSGHAMGEDGDRVVVALSGGEDGDRVVVALLEDVALVGLVEQGVIVGLVEQGVIVGLVEQGVIVALVDGEDNGGDVALLEDVALLDGKDNGGDVALLEDVVIVAGFCISITFEAEQELPLQPTNDAVIKYIPAFLQMCLDSQTPLD